MHERDESMTCDMSYHGTCTCTCPPHAHVLHVSRTAAQQRTTLAPRDGSRIGRHISRSYLGAVERGRVGGRAYHGAYGTVPHGGVHVSTRVRQLSYETSKVRTPLTPPRRRALTILTYLLT